MKQSIYALMKIYGITRKQEITGAMTLFFVFSIFIATAQPWTQLPLTGSTASSSLLGIHFVDDRIGYVVGTNGLISKTTDGGVNWTVQTSTAVGLNALYATYFIDANTGFAVGNNGVVIKTDNGGTTWTAPPIPTAFANHSFRAVWFFNAYEGYITGGLSASTGTILKTTDGGLTWADKSPIPNNGDVIYGIYFTDAQTGFATDFDGHILRTTTGGNGAAPWATIYTSPNNNLHGVYFTSRDTGYVVGGNVANKTGIILKTVNANTSTPTWTAFNAPSGNFLTDIKFFGNTGFAAGGDPTLNTTPVIYKNTPFSNTWTAQPLIPNTLQTTATRQYRITLPCSHTGYSCGTNGTILRITGINEKICCDSFNNTFINTNFTHTNNLNTYTFTKPTGTATGDILTWSFGDGQTGTGSPINHTYPSVSGSYLATLTITRPQLGGDTCKVKLCKLIDTKPCSNLVTNGDFSLGNTGFTTGLLSGCTAATDCFTGYYCVGNNFTNKCSSWPSVFDHTFGNATGSFMSVDGTTSAVGATEFWRNASISVVPNTTYKFSFWLNSVHPTLPAGQSLNLDMVIDGNGTTNPVPIIRVPTISQATLGSNSTWRQYSTIWVCPAGVSTVDLALRQVSSGAYRDFGIDDISFTCVNCEDFMTDINNFGIQSTLVSGNTYKYCVSPNISPTDIVQWDMDCNGTIDATTNTPCNNFTLTSANSQLCATVLHVIKAGDTCRTKVNICLPNIIPPKPCVCDSTFNNSVNAGFTWAKSTPYTVTFTPSSLLNNCDSVRWTASGIGGFIGNSLGMSGITYTFPSTPGTYQICMFVTRTTPNGTVCRREVCISLTLTGQVRASDIELLKLVVRPNPTAHSTSISVPEQLLNKKNTIRINSLEGRTMTTTAVESLEMTLSLDNLPTGMYFLSLYDDKGNMLTRPTKFVKQ